MRVVKATFTYFILNKKGKVPPVQDEKDRHAPKFMKSEHLI
jgi:hypothetical protein